MRISRREIKRNEAPALATGFHPSRSRFPEEAPRVFPPLLRGGADRPPFHLSSPRFISIFLRAFCVQFHLASLLCHVLFLFPRLSLCHSRSRRARSSRFTTPLSPPSPRSFFPVLPSQFLPSLFLLVPSPFSSISRPSFRLPPSPCFFLSLGRFIASSSTLRSPASRLSLHPAFPSFAAHVASIYSFPLPSTSKTLFSCGPFASTVIRHPSPPPPLSLSFSFPPSFSLSLSFFLPTPTTERQPHRFPHILPYIHPSVSFSSSPTFYLTPPYIHLSIFSFRFPPRLPFHLASSSPR